MKLYLGLVRDPQIPDPALGYIKINHLKKVSSLCPVLTANPRHQKRGSPRAWAISKEADLTLWVLHGALNQGLMLGNTTQIWVSTVKLAEKPEAVHLQS